MALPSWLCVLEAFVLKITIPAKKGEKHPDGTPKKGGRYAAGVKFKMADGSWWFYSFKYESWSCHHPLVVKTDKWGNPVTVVKKAAHAPQIVYLPETIDKYASFDILVREWENHPYGLDLLDALVSAKEGALAADAA